MSRAVATRHGAQRWIVDATQNAVGLVGDGAVFSLQVTHAIDAHFVAVAYVHQVALGKQHTAASAITCRRLANSGRRNEAQATYAHVTFVYKVLNALAIGALRNSAWRDGARANGIVQRSIASHTLESFRNAAVDTVVGCALVCTLGKAQLISAGTLSITNRIALSRTEILVQIEIWVARSNASIVFAIPWHGTRWIHAVGIHQHLASHERLTIGLANSGKKQLVKTRKKCYCTNSKLDNSRALAGAKVALDQDGATTIGSSWSTGTKVNRLGRHAGNVEQCHGNSTQNHGTARHLFVGRPKNNFNVYSAQSMSQLL